MEQIVLKLQLFHVQIIAMVMENVIQLQEYVLAIQDLLLLIAFLAKILQEKLVKYLELQAAKKDMATSHMLKLIANNIVVKWEYPMALEAVIFQEILIDLVIM